MKEDFPEKNKIKSRVLTDEDKEDILMKMMEETDYDDTTDTLLKNLRS